MKDSYKSPTMIVNKKLWEQVKELWEQVKEENQRLKDLLDLAMGTIEFYANGEIGNDLEIRPEKKDLWSIPEKWSQRSMSDHYVGKRARATREEILKRLGEIK